MKKPKVHPECQQALCHSKDEVELCLAIINGRVMDLSPSMVGDAITKIVSQSVGRY